MQFADHRLAKILDSADRRKPKAIVDIFTLDGKLVESHEFRTNQEAADLIVTYMGKPMDINYRPIGCRPMCSACWPALRTRLSRCTPNESLDDTMKLLLDIL